MKLKALFIMITILLAAQFGVAQEAIVVYEGAETTHSVDNHPGSTYFWEVFKNFNPDVPADPTEFYFTGSNTSNTVAVHWIKAGIYYLKVTETDANGCTNVKALAISVIPNDRSIGFVSTTSSACRIVGDNGFVLPLNILDNNGDQLDASEFPVEVDYTVNGTSYSQTVPYDNQELLIGGNMFSLAPAGNTTVLVEITGATDNDGAGISPSASKLHTRTIFALPEIEFTTNSVSVTQGDNFNHQVRMSAGNGGGSTYSWSVTPAGGTSTDLSVITSNMASILWDGAVGNYTLSVVATDVNGCVSNVTTQTVQVTPPIVLGDLIFSDAYPDDVVCSDLSSGEGSMPAENTSTFEIEYLGDSNLSSATITVLNPSGIYVGLDGQELADQLNPEITIDNVAETKQIQFSVTHSWENTENTTLSYEISLIWGELADGNQVPGTSGKNLRYIFVLSKPVITFINVPDTIQVNSNYSFEATGNDSYSYSWWFVDENDQRTDFTSTTNKTEEYFWDTEGIFDLYAQATDSFNCLTAIISQSFVVGEKQGGGQPDEPELFAIPDFVIGVENTDIVGDVKTNDFIFPFDTSEVVYHLLGDSLPGLILKPDGTFIYQPASNLTGKFYFSYELCFKNGNGTCSLAEVEIRILSSVPDENIKPVASTDVVLTMINQAVSGNTLVNDANYVAVDISVLSISEIPVESPGNGTVELFADGSFTYTPDSGFIGIDQFRYQLCNKQEPYLCDSAWVYIYVNTFDSETQTPPISVYDDLVVYRKDSSYSVAENDFALDGFPLLYNTAPVEGVSNGTLQLMEDGTFRYQPNPGFIGIDWFVYEVCGGPKGTNCRTATAFIAVGENEFTWIVDAGNDTTIGSCEPYMLEAYVSDTLGMSYFWFPHENLDDPTSPTPVFTPGNTTTFTLTVTNSFGASASDTVRIEVSEIVADAGEDFVIEEGMTAMLDGSGSFGAELEYLWSTENGTIESGANTANPIISSQGTYFLQVRDSFNCTASDSVVVSRVSYAPIARDDYDTTEFQTEVRIAVLENDEDPDGDLDPNSLTLVQFPVNGTAYINYDDYTISYIPNDGFTGNDVFEYQICDLTDLCDNAYVYVLVIKVDFLIPEAFTPNGDNINDYFEIQGIHYYPGNKLTIVNRWGKKVYEERNYGIDTNPKYWDGKYTLGDKSDVPTGTYFYVLELGNGQKPIAGSIYIDR